MSVYDMSKHMSATDVEFPSVCYEYVLLPLVNKEAALAGQNIR